jgi:hypothetical protein
MITKLILEDGIQLSKYKRAKILDDYNVKGLVSLPDGVIVKSIQELPAEQDHAGQNVYTTILIFGRQK